MDNLSWLNQTRNRLNNSPIYEAMRKKLLEQQQQSISEPTKVDKNEPFVRQSWFKFDSSVDKNDKLFHTIDHTNAKECGLCSQLFTRRYKSHKENFAENSICCVCRIQFSNKTEYTKHIEQMPLLMKCCSCKVLNKTEPVTRDKDDFLEHIPGCIKKRQRQKLREAKKK